MQLNTKVRQLNRVGKTLEKRLSRLGIETVEDLLYYFPFRYEDYSKTVNIEDLKDGEQVTVKGKIELIANKRSPRKRKIITEAVVVDETDRIKVVWFGQPFITKNLRAGDTVYLSGKVNDSMFGMQMIGPAYEKEGKTGTTHTARIVPIYSLTSGITQKQIRFLMSQVIKMAEKLDDWLPDDILEQVDLVPLKDGIKGIHFPEDKIDLAQSEKRLKFDELFLLQLRAEILRQSIKKSQAPQIKFKELETKKFVDALPFTLTKAQKIATWEILQDLEKRTPMNRMLEGDVGAGKTVVSAIVMYNCILNDFQTAMMAPTEILAKQHFESLLNLFNDNLKIGLFTRTQKIINDKKASKKEFISLLESGDVDIVVGTHALLVDKVNFKDLGLVIVDEQHRFGVEQRKKIKEQSGNKKTTPHFLSMTATPIPRSFALTLYGDLDLSIINEMPKGRKPVKTRLVDPHNREKAYEFIKDQVKQGRQVFVVCPLIEEGQNVSTGLSEKKSVMAEYEKLSKQIFPDLEIAYLHGKMKADDKNKSMKKFSEGKIDILVSTSVIEVGVDVPNASVMMIEGAERFGLAQLHQFRGRVGRSSHQSYCFLFTDSDSEKAQKRLGYFESTNDGFKLAEYDLKLRGPGDVYGVAQSGMMNFRLATMRDVALIKMSRDIARGIDFKKYPSLKEKIADWEEKVHLE
ncbi:MAG: ATP-dependent DNA helicase RecG [Candidatus Magasanikbacteria bacterium]|nr:ATP-dependent DNA helicase RecG [Candidatus Magasanikbacteria bacterium]